MKKYFFSILAISILFFHGCRKDDDKIVGEGEIYYEGHVYQLNNVTKTITPEPSPWEFIDGVPVWVYSHKLHLTSTDGRNNVNIRIVSKNDIEPLSGEYFFSANGTAISGLSIISEIVLGEIYNDYFFQTSNKMNLVYTKKGDIYEIELKDFNSENDFYVKWEGPIKEIKK